jgi:AraC family transcriptional regulator
MIRKQRVACLNRVEAGGFSVAEMAYPPGLQQQRHAHADSGITLVLAGSLEETVARAHERAYALSVVVKPLDTEHANSVGNTGARTLQIRINSLAFDDELRVLGAWRWCHRGAIVREFLQVLRCFRNGAVDDVETAVFDLIGAARETFIHTHEPPHWLKQVREHIDALLPASVRVSDVARAANVHPVYLARQFRRFLGYSVTEYICARRMQRAADLLAASSSSLAGAAYGAGYSDQSHLTRTFRNSIGVTPQNYRALVRAQV